MPEISRFLGISVRLYYRDSGPAHLHAGYGDYEVTIDLEAGGVSGSFPPRAMTALLEWYGMHKGELLSRHLQASEERQLDRIDPLE